jgi:hypothetical protein
MKYTRDKSGAAILADPEKIREYMERKQERDAVQRLTDEINTLKREIEELKAAVFHQTKSE